MQKIEVQIAIRIRLKQTLLVSCLYIILQTYTALPVNKASFVVVGSTQRQEILGRFRDLVTEYLNLQVTMIGMYCHRLKQNIK